MKRGSAGLKCRGTGVVTGTMRYYYVLCSALLYSVVVNAVDTVETEYC